MAFRMFLLLAAFLVASSIDFQAQEMGAGVIRLSPPVEGESLSILSATALLATQGQKYGSIKGVIGKKLMKPSNESVHAAAVMLVMATAYNAVPSQTDSTPDITACNTKTRPHIIAVSNDLKKILPCGTVVEVRVPNAGLPGFLQRFVRGRFAVEDSLAPRAKNQIDILMSEYQSAMTWGRREVVLKVIKRPKP